MEPNRDAAEAADREFPSIVSSRRFAGRPPTLGRLRVVSVAISSYPNVNT